MQVVVTIRIYGYMETSNTINKGYRDKIIKKFLLKINILKKVEKGGVIFRATSACDRNTYADNKTLRKKVAF